MDDDDNEQISLNRIGSSEIDPREFSSNESLKIYNEENNDIDRCDEYIRNLVDKIDNDTILRQQTDSTALKDVLRAIPERLTNKRKIKAELLRRSSLKCSSVFNFSQQIRRLSNWQYLLYNISIAVSKVNRLLYDFVITYELWYDSLKTIESYFGSAIGTYFRFYRFLFLLNLIPLVLSLAFVVIPQMLHSSSYSSSVPLFNSTDNSSKISRKLIWKNSDENNFNIYAIITGKEYFEKSVLFYGYYSNDTFNFGPISYSIPKAYLYATCVSYILTLIILCVYTTKSYCDYFVKSTGELNHQFCLKIFTGWDFSIATENAAQLHQEILYHEMKELLDEQKSHVTKSTGFLDVAFLLLTRLIVNIIFVAVMCLIGWHSSCLLHLINDTSSENQTCMFGYFVSAISNSDNKKYVIFYPLYISGCLMFTIRTFLWLIRYEKYNGPRTPLYVNMIRMFIVELVIVCVFYKFWFEIRGNIDQCWETYVGQGFYQLLVVDFLLCTSVTFIYSLIFFGFLKLFKEKLSIVSSCKSVEFAIANNTFSLIHNQILFWAGYYFSPVLSLIIAIFMFVSFYIKKYSLLYVYSPPTRTWRTAQMQTFFSVLTFLSLLVIMSVHGFIIFNIQPSKNCGPFKGFDNRTYQAIFSGGGSDGNDIFWLWKLINYLQKPGVIFAIFVILSVNMYFLRTRSETEIELANTIRSILVLQGKDKQFLAQFMSEIMNESTVDNVSSNDNEEEVMGEQNDNTENFLDKKSHKSESSPANRNSLILLEIMKKSRHNERDDLKCKHKDYFNVATSFLVEQLRGIPGSPRTARFTTEPKRKSNENRKLSTRFITHHKTGLYM